MSYYINQEYDFISRTKIIIEQYEKAKIPKNEKFEVTLLLNCLVGLLILPQQNWYDSLPTSIVSEEEWGIGEQDISFMKQGETKNVKDIARHLRNSVSHYHFKAFKNEINDIEYIKFEDFNKQDSKTFDANISVNGVKQFTAKLTDIFISEMDKQK